VVDPLVVLAALDGRANQRHERERPNAQPVRPDHFLPRLIHQRLAHVEKYDRDWHIRLLSYLLAPSRSSPGSPASQGEHSV